MGIAGSLMFVLLCGVATSSAQENPQDGPLSVLRLRGPIESNVARKTEIDAYVDGLLEPGRELTVANITALAKFGPRGQQAIDRILAYVDSEDHELRLAAVETLAKIGVGNVMVLTTLIKLAVEDSDAEVRAQAVQHLPGIGFAEADVLPTLTHALSDESARVRWTALSAAYEASGSICDFRGSDETILKALRDPEAEVRVTALGLIGVEAYEHGGIPRSVVEQLARMTNDDAEYPHAYSLDFIGTRTVQYQVMETLASIGQDAFAALPAVLARIDAGKQDSMSDADWDDLRTVALGAVFQITKDPSLVVDGLRPALKSDSDALLTALYLLSDIGPAAGSLVPDVAGQLKDESPVIRRVACEVLPRLGPKAASAKDALRSLIDNDEDEGVVEAARSALEQIDIWPESAGLPK